MKIAMSDRNTNRPVTRAWAKRLEKEAGRNLDPVDRGLQLTTAASQQIGDASILQGESAAPLQVESTNMAPSPGLLTAPSPDHSASALLHKEEQDENDEVAGDDLQQQLDAHDSLDVPVLPADVVLVLFEFMKPGDILSASQTCHLWRKLGERDELWRQKCKEAGLAFVLTPANRKSLEHRSQVSSIAYSAWKESFLKPNKIDRKLRKGVPHIITIEISHDVTKMEIFNEKIVTSGGQNLYIFCAVSGQLLHTLVGHTRYVRDFKMDDQFIVSGCHDRSVKVWDVDTGSSVHTMLGHSGEVTCLVMQGNVAVSGSSDRTLRMWDVREGRCKETLSGHTGAVRSVQFDGNVVVSGSYDKTIKIWDPVTGECRRTMNHSSYVISLKFNSDDVVAGYIDGYMTCSIKVWDVTTGVCSHTIEGNNSWIMELQDDALVCLGEDRTTTKIWSTSTGDHLHTLAGAQKHSTWITGFQLVGKLVVTSSVDGTVKLWDVTTGQFIKDLLVLESGGRVEKMKTEDAKIVCAVVSNEGFKLLVLNFDNTDEN